MFHEMGPWHVIIGDHMSEPDFVAIKTRQQAAWASGDYAAVGSAIQLIAELLVEAMDPRSLWHVLDVAGGSGNASLAVARRGCRVTSTDFIPALLGRGRQRAEAEGLARITFLEADAEALPFADSAFDAAISTVGVMFAPDHTRAAAELFRVVRPGGVIGLANWTPTGFVGQIFTILSTYLPPAPGMQAPSLWGTEPHLRTLFPHAASIHITPRAFVFRAPSAEAWLVHFRTFYGPMLRAYAALDEAQQHSLTVDLLALCGSLNRSGDPTLVLPSDYVEVIIRK